MKRVIYTLFIFLFAVHAMAQSPVESCKLGFTFEISNDPVWGENEPVVVGITPGSPAEQAGLQINDIILEVNGHGTFLKPHGAIMSWFTEDDAHMSVSIRNLRTSFKNIRIAKDCRRPNAIKEVQLAPVFSFYSLEDVQERQFLIPVKTTVNKNAAFFQYRPFDFSPSDESTSELDEQINAIFIRALGEKGLVRDTENPDFIIQTYYNYQNNPLFKSGSPTYNSYQSAWRFDMRNKRMVKLPLYDPSEAVRVDDIMYNLEFGCRFYDRKFVQPGEMTLIWEGQVKERMNRNYDIRRYLEMNLPLILLKFPYSGNKSFGTYHVKYLAYNYTGIAYDMNDLKTVVAVDANSPAAQAGILPGDIVSKIQNQEFNHTARSLTEGYRRFIAETLKYRDASTRYTDSNGFKECMFWDISHYSNIAKELNDKRYRAAFSYLFNFNQYVSWDASLVLNVEADRNGEKMDFYVKPEKKVSSHIFVY